jgi:hypothetical protein
MIYVEIDLHFDNMVIVTINSNGKVIQEAKLPSSRRALNDFFSSFDESVLAVVEYTGFWYWLGDWCREHDIELSSHMPRWSKP